MTTINEHLIEGMDQLGRLTFNGGFLFVEPRALDSDFVSYSRTDVGATAWACLIDLSGGPGWPHTETGAINIEYMSMQVDKAANAVGRLQVGVVTRVDGTNGDVTVFRGLIFENNSEDHIDRAENFSPNRMRTRVTAGETPHILSSTRILNDTGIQTDVALDSPLGAGTVFPAVGDIVVRFLYETGGTFTGAVSAIYRASA